MNRNKLIKIVFFSLLAQLAILLPHSLSNYYLQIMNIALINALLVIGVNFIVGYTGEISFAQSGFWCIGAYTSAIVITRLQMPFLVGFLAALLVCAAVAFLFGYPTLRLKSHYFALATLGFTEIMHQLALNMQGLTGGGAGFPKIASPGIGPWLFDTKLKFYYFALVFVVLALFVALRIERSKYGRAFMSIRESEMAAGATGVNISYYKIIAFMLSGIFGGAAGSLYASMSTYIAPDLFTTGFSVTCIIMLLAGGIGNAWGAALGAIILTFLPEWLRFFANYYMIIYGFGILLILIFMPKGLVGLGQNLIDKIKTRLLKAKVKG